MATLLLLVIYLSFIGLGIPDSLLGCAWPAIYREFSLPVSAATLVSMLISGGTIVSSLCSARLLHRFGTARVTACSTALTAAALLGFSLSGNLWLLCLCAVPLGLGAGAVDVGLNNYVALHYRASHMNFLHCFYGIGVSVSPYLMSRALAGGQWRSGYRAAAVFQLGIALLLFCSLPLWHRVHPVAPEDGKAPASRPLRRKELLRLPGLLPACLLFAASCGIESTCGGWGSTFLVEARGVSAEQAASLVIFFYIGMTLGRFLSGVLSLRLSGWRLIFLGMGVMTGAIVLLLLPLPREAAAAGLFLIGLGNGPLFPNLIHLTPRHFGREVSGAAMGVQMAASYAGSMLLPALFGLLAQVVGAWLFPVYLGALFILLVLSGVYLYRRAGRPQPATCLPDSRGV